MTQKPALELEPERLETFETAVERQLRPGLRGSLAVYHTKAKNLIALVTDPADELLVYANGDQVRSTGVEVALEGRLTRRVSARASCAYQHAMEGEDDVRPVNSPAHMAHLATSLTLAGGRVLPGIEARYLGARLELFAKVSNVFDVAYHDPGGEEHRQDLLARDGRTAWFSVRYRF